MRWGPWDADGSVASLAEDSEQRDLGVRVDEDAGCSSGGAVAHLSEIQLQQLIYGADIAVLDADITDGEWFEFSMSGLHGRPQCTWYGVGGTQTDHGYEFDLKRPNWCANSDGCAIDPSSMRTATISTHWKKQESLALSIRSLEFWPSSGEWVWNGMPDSQGEASVCWRPVTYEPSPVASALWGDSGRGVPWDRPRWPVYLAGEFDNGGGSTGSTAEIAAFILGGALDLSGCTAIDFDPAPPSKYLQITVEDANGLTCQATLESGHVAFTDFSSCNDCQGEWKLAQALDAVRKATTRIALRRTWNEPIHVTDALKLEVDGISFEPPGCAVPVK
jgi:hypothetical protein